MTLAVDVLSASWAILEESSPFILAGFILAGVVKVYLPLDMVRKSLGGGFSSVIKAAALGVPLPLCSCSVIPTAAALRSAGASKGATSSFLISTPETGLDSIAVSYALLDPLMTVFRPVAAFYTAVLAGGLEILFGSVNHPPKEGPVVESSCGDDCCADDCEAGQIARPLDLSKSGRAVAVARFAFGELLDDLAAYMAAGILAAGLVAALVPAGFFNQLQGHGALTMLLALAAGIPMYICATASTPLAAALIVKGLSPGAALVFLLSGPATNIGTLMIVKKLLGARSVAIYLTAISLGALSSGVALDWIYSAWALDPSAVMGKAAEPVPHWLETGSAALFTALMARSIAADLLRRLSATPASNRS